jgi:hypothetical protein
MKSAVVLLPGLNRDRDMIAALIRKHLIIHPRNLEALFKRFSAYNIAL